MRSRALALLVLLACAKSRRGGPDPGGPDLSTAESAARAFVVALASGDTATAAKILPDDTTCAQYAGDSAEVCKRSVPELRQRLPGLVKGLEGFKPGRIHDTDQPPPGMPPGVRVLEVEPEGGGKPFELIAVGVSGGFRIAFPMRMKKLDTSAPTAPPR